MCRQNRQVVISRRNHAVAANEISRWHICCVAAITMGHEVGRRRFIDAGRLQEIVKRHPSPRRIELRPFCNAMEVCLAAVWTQKAIELGYRSRMTEEFAILGMVQKGWITGLDGKKFGSVGLVVNCPIPLSVDGICDPKPGIAPASLSSLRY